MNFQPPDPPEQDHDDYWVCDYCHGKRLEGSPEFWLTKNHCFCSDDCRDKYQAQL